MRNRSGTLSIGSCLNMIVVAAVVFFLWVPDYLPMIDLPQHAAQVSLFLDLIKDESLFHDIVEVNYFTPYWIGYGPLSILAFFLDISIAIKIFVSLVFVAYYYSVRFFLQAVKSPPQLAILTVPSFFGFSFEWGFLTFIAAIPAGLFYLGYLLRNLDRTDNLWFLIKLSILGAFLFFSHALIFVFFVFVGFLYQAVWKIESNKLFIFPFVLPYFLFFCLLLCFIFRADPLLGQFSYGDELFIYSSGANRFAQLFSFPWSMIAEPRVYIFSAALIASPFVFGYELSKKPEKYISFIFFIAIWSVLPHYFNKVFFVYERFSVFAFIFYFSIFEEAKHKSGVLLGYIRSLFLPIFAVVLMHKPLLDIYLFKNESKEFSSFLDSIDSGRRVLSLVFHKESPYISNPFVYVHFPLWYQAEKQGFVDFNFSWFSPQVVRFKAEMAPEVKPSFEWRPHEFRSIKSCHTYEALIVRHAGPDSPNVVDIGDCTFTYDKNKGFWYYYINTNNY